MPSKNTLDVRDLRRRFRLNRRMFARLVGYSERAVASWEAGKPPASGGLTRLHEIKRLYDALAKVMEPNAVGEWLETPNKAFGRLKPIEVIERGELDRIWRMIFFLESGVSS